MLLFLYSFLFALFWFFLISFCCILFIFCTNEFSNRIKWFPSKYIKLRDTFISAERCFYLFVPSYFLFSDYGGYTLFINSLKNCFTSRRKRPTDQVLVNLGMIWLEVELVIVQIIFIFWWTEREKKTLDKKWRVLSYPFFQYHAFYFRLFALFSLVFRFFILFSSSSKPVNNSAANSASSKCYLF